MDYRFDYNRMYIEHNIGIDYLQEMRKEVINEGHVFKGE